MKRFRSNWLACSCAALYLTLGAPAWASGGEGPYDTFVLRRGTDISPDRYDQGTLGVLLPSYGRVYLYPAWRAIVLGADGLKAAGTSPGALRTAIGGYVSDYVDEKHPWRQWMDESNKALQRPSLAGFPIFRSVSRSTNAYPFGYLNCPAPTFIFAMQNLAMLARRSDSTHERLAEWVSAQDTVFDFCDYQPGSPAWANQRKTPPPVIPAPLPASEPRFWQQMREYQIASAHFYNESPLEAMQRFDRIAATRDHPMQRLGAYLAMRAQLRLASFSRDSAWQTDNPELLRQLSSGKGIVSIAAPTLAPGDPKMNEFLEQVLARGQRILADSSLQPLHEATRGLMRTARYRLTPLERFAQLTDRLDDLSRSPYEDSTLADWRRLADDFFDGESAQSKTLDAGTRARHEWFDWMRTLQQCGLPIYGVADTCEIARANAARRWRESAGKPGPQRAWLTAYMVIAERFVPGIEKAALDVPSSAPEYLTVRYNLARLYRLTDRPAKARGISDAVLKGQAVTTARSNSAQQLFMQERFAMATSLDDATPWLVRMTRWRQDADTGETLENPESPASHQLAGDGLTWTNGNVSVADLLTLAKSRQLPAGIRMNLAVAAWWRADLLGQSAAADEAARLVVGTPRFAAAANAYLSAGSVAQKRHALVLQSLRLGMSPLVSSYVQDFSKPPAAPTAASEDETTASMWCTVGRMAKPSDDPWNAGAEKSPPPPDLSTAPAVRDREIARLGKLPTATGFVGAHVLERVKTNPTDPDLPWLLHVVVMSTRGGCLDPDSRTLSRTAWNVLHTRFKTSPWAGKTPYWY